MEFISQSLLKGNTVHHCYQILCIPIYQLKTMHCYYQIKTYRFRIVFDFNESGHGSDFC